MTPHSLPIARSVLVLQIEYTAWATGLLLEAAKNLSDEELRRDMRGSHGSLLDTLRHIYYADRIWLARLEGEARDFRDTEAEPALADLQRVWPELLTRFQRFVGELPEAELAADLHYKSLKGTSHSVARWKVLLHVVNHGTLHRGQVMAMVRQLGQQPPATDLIFFYLQK